MIARTSRPHSWKQQDFLMGAVCQIFLSSVNQEKCCKTSRLVLQAVASRLCLMRYPLSSFGPWSKTILPATHTASYQSACHALPDHEVGAVRELCPRGMPGMACNSKTKNHERRKDDLLQEEAVQAGVANNGMGPIAQKLTQQEVPPSILVFRSCSLRALDWTPGFQMLISWRFPLARQSCSFAQPAASGAALTKKAEACKAFKTGIHETAYDRQRTWQRGLDMWHFPQQLGSRIHRVSRQLSSSMMHAQHSQRSRRLSPSISKHCRPFHERMMA